MCFPDDVQRTWYSVHNKNISLGEGEKKGFRSSVGVTAGRCLFLSTRHHSVIKWGASHFMGETHISYLGPRVSFYKEQSSSFFVGEYKIRSQDSGSQMAHHDWFSLNQPCFQPGIFLLPSTVSGTPGKTCRPNLSREKPPVSPGWMRVSWLVVEPLEEDGDSHWSYTDF